MTNLLTKKQLIMTSIFAGLPNDLIIKIVQIENRRKYEKERMKFRDVIQQLNKFLSLYSSRPVSKSRMCKAHIRLAHDDSRHYDYLLQYDYF